MRSTVVIIGLAATAVIGLTVGAITGSAAPAFADPGAPDGIHTLPPPDGSGIGRADGPDAGPRPAWHRRPDFKLALARNLAGLEAIVGIRADQLDAWHDYTSALLAMLEPPRPPVEGAANDDGPEVFGLAEHLADGMIARAAAAGKLKAAIAVLRDRLTPEQIALLQKAETRMGPPLPGRMPPFGPGPQRPRFAPPDAERPAPDAG